MFRKMRRFTQEQSVEVCEKILKEEKRGVLSIIDENGYPYGIPLNYIYIDGKIYFHGAKSGKKVDCLRANNKACFTVYNQGWQEEGSWIYNPTSVICFGKIRFVEDVEECTKFCRPLGLKYYPNAKDVEKEIQGFVKNVLILELNIEHMTGKLVNES